MMWMVARNWSRFVPEGHHLFKKEGYINKLSYDDAICVIAAKLVRMAFAMARDGSHFDASQAFPSRGVRSQACSENPAKITLFGGVDTLASLDFHLLLTCLVLGLDTSIEISCEDMFAGSLP
jgi:hypothetical protein